MPPISEILLALILTFSCLLGINFMRHRFYDEKPLNFMSYLRQGAKDSKSLLNRKDLSVIAFMFIMALGIPYVGARITRHFGYPTFSESLKRAESARNATHTP